MKAIGKIFEEEKSTIIARPELRAPEQLARPPGPSLSPELSILNEIDLKFWFEDNHAATYTKHNNTRHFVNTDLSNRFETSRVQEAHDSIQTPVGLPLRPRFLMCYM